MKKLFTSVMLIASIVIASINCSATNPKIDNQAKPFTGAKGEIKLMTLDPGHFHAALVQKNMYDQISPEVYVYAPAGNDLGEHLKKIEAYNTRADKPTAWKEKVYTGPDFFEKMLSEKPGNVVVLAGNNRIKTDYIKKSIEAGLNVLADKPMVITPGKFADLEEAFKIAHAKNVLLYDIMTERYEITTMLEKELSQRPALFGKLQKGTPQKPGVEKASVHFFYKAVSGNPLIRPAWFFDIRQQGEGIVDVATHLVDLVQWGCFPGQIIHKSDIQMLSARRWPTVLTLDEFKEVTKENEYPDYLKKDIKDGKLMEYANGSMTYKLKGVYVKVTAEWKYKAPENSGDTHYSVTRGTLCNLEIHQGKAENYLPTLYIYANKGTDLKKLSSELDKAIVNNPTTTGLTLEKINATTWKVNIPDRYKVGHEAHFGQVTDMYLNCLKDGKLPAWEEPNMIAKYYTTTSALKLAMKKK
ncbi:MAG: putative oxidoreductase C-terminal domain-containing protein [Bacteroidota bacterium]|nr:putative oxidoreductase C-terminal domain-containing protein [Bacteroidota bacterium]